MTNCSNLPFAVMYNHVCACQDIMHPTQYLNLFCTAKLSSQVDLGAKGNLTRNGAAVSTVAQRSFPLEAVTILVGGRNVTMDNTDSVWFWAQR